MFEPLVWLSIWMVKNLSSIHTYTTGTFVLSFPLVHVTSGAWIMETQLHILYNDTNSPQQLDTYCQRGMGFYVQRCAKIILCIKTDSSCFHQWLFSPLALRFVKTGSSICCFKCQRYYGWRVFQPHSCKYRGVWKWMFCSAGIEPSLVVSSSSRQLGDEHSNPK